MQNKALIIVAVVLGIVALGLVTFVVYQKYITKPVAEVPTPAPTPVVATVTDTKPIAPPPPPKYPVLYAKQDILENTLLTAQLLEVQEKDTEVLDALRSINEVTGQPATSTQFIAKGSPILRTQVHQGAYAGFVARTSIPANAIITEAMLEVRNFDVRPADFISVDQKAQILNTVAKNAIAQGRIITKADVFGTGAAQLSFLIPIYKRAVTLQITGPLSANNFMIRQGDVVDVIAKFDKTYAGVDVTRTIVQSAEVLALDQQLVEVPRQPVLEGQDPKSAPATYQFVTLSVTPREADKLVFSAKHASEIRLALRSPLQRRTEESPPTTTQDEVLGDGFGQPVTVEIYNAAQRTTAVVEEY